MKINSLQISAHIWGQFIIEWMCDVKTKTTVKKQKVFLTFVLWIDFYRLSIELENLGVNVPWTKICMHVTKMHYTDVDN